ncbi:DNA-directed RNA polymerase I subunit RPA49 [Leptodactylus fuscus]|uniref:DNA-directed RNA polymerase I subunit RPA49 n=1 Tax=Leptodactylus fuscus TaxID=238119 RepID=UPI003F4F39A6
MAGKATWEYRGEPERPALLVQFSNGTIQTPENISFALYKNKTKRQRILTAETERLNYVGNNFSPQALKSSTLCRYFVGVLNKETGKMEVYDAEQFNMQPILKDSTDDHQEQDQPRRTYRERVDALIEVFGTNKQKRALSSRKLNLVENEFISKEMAKAADEIIESKGTTELVREVADRTEEESHSLFLPPCCAAADKQEDVYPFNQLITPEEYMSLENVSAAFRNITPEELQERTDKKQLCSFVLQQLADLKFAKDVNHQVRVLWYINALVNLSQRRLVKRRDLVAMECPNVVIGKFLKNFTVPVFKNDSVQRSISPTMKCKIVSYVMALALHLCDFQVDLTVLQRDLKLSEKRIIEIAKAMRLRINKKFMFSSLFMGEGHQVGILELPLPTYKPLGRPMKRTNF